MKKLIVGIICLFAGMLCLAQGGNEQETLYQAELNKMVTIPNSPEAEAFQRYGDTDVSLYSGTPQISVPLYSIPGREMNIPISLTYDASGIKVEQLATCVGLGWNLNVGGRISRVTNGLADDYIQGNYETVNDTAVFNRIKTYKLNSNDFPSPEAIEEYYEFLYDINTNLVDAEPDYFNLSAPGLNETFVIDIKNGIGNALNNPRIKITPIKGSSGYHSIVGWEVIGEDGTKYFFNSAETTRKYGDDTTVSGVIINEYNSSWLLTQIISSNEKDNFQFTYTEFNFWEQEQLGSSASRIIMDFVLGQFNYPQVPPAYGGGTGYAIKQQFINAITHNADTLLTIDMGTRHDIDNGGNVTRLDQLNFFNLDGTNLRTISFDNDHYFNHIESNAIENESPFDIRLKLDGIEIKGKELNTYQTYTFEYDRPNDLPSRTSLSQDFLGYYNGANNGVLYPKYTTDFHVFEGADREPDTEMAKIGMLKKITYPTKGYSLFEFENHEEYRGTTNVSTVNYLNIALNGSSNTNPSLYFRDDGITPCDDEFLDGNPPKILIKSFSVQNAGQYDLSYIGNGTSSQAYMAYLGTSNANAGDYQNFCDFYDNIGSLYWLSGSNNPNTITLETGYYIAMIVLDESGNGTYGETRLKVSREEMTSNFRNVDIGGLRIQSIRDYTATDLASYKFYRYTDTAVKSTGKVKYRPLLATVKNTITETGEKSRLIRTTAFPRGDEPYVIYNEVREVRLDGLGRSEGSVVHKFYEGDKGAVPRSDAPFESNFYPSLKVGEFATQESYHENGDLVAKQQVEFYENSLDAVLVNGRVSITDEVNLGKYILIDDFLTGQNETRYKAVYLDRYDCGGVPSPNGGGVLCSTPQYVTNPQGAGYVDILPSKYSGLNSRTTFARGVYGGVTMTVDSTYYKDSNNVTVAIATTQNTEYDAAIGYLPRKSSTTDSEGDLLETVYTYPYDLNHTSLLAKNHVNVPLKTVTTKNPNTTPELIATQEYTYENIVGNIVLPTLIQTAKGNHSDDDRVEFSYNLNGNLSEAKQTKGPTTVYIWGYDNRFPVAKVDNASHSAVIATGINTNIINDPITSEAVITSELNKIRNGLPNAMVTTYTYDPLVGVTSVTDPRGYTMYYEYDEFNRLQFVRDADNNLISENQYNYKNQN